MNNFTINNWTYKKSNNTINFKTKQYSYEVDLDRKDSTPQMWLEHLDGKNKDLISNKDLEDLKQCFINLGLCEAEMKYFQISKLPETHDI